MFTKEIVFTLPFIILLLELSFNQGGGLKEIITKPAVLKIAVPVLLFAIIIPGMLYINGDFKVIFTPVESNRFLDPALTPATYLMTQFRVIVTYIRLLFLPVNQNLDHDFPASLTFFEFSTVVSFLFLVFLVLFAMGIYKRKRLAAFGIFWFFLTIFVESSIIPLKNVIFEHRLYLPLFGFCLIVVSTFHDLLWKRFKTGVNRDGARKLHF